jgi:hypothetical protein
MLRDVLEGAIAAQPDMELVASSDAASLETAIAVQQPDVVIVAEERASLDLVRLELAPTIRRLAVLTVAAGGSEARLLELTQIPVSDVSLHGLVDTIRAVARDRDT